MGRKKRKRDKQPVGNLPTKYGGFLYNADAIKHRIAVASRCKEAAESALKEQVKRMDAMARAWKLEHAALTQKTDDELAMWTARCEDIGKKLSAAEDLNESCNAKLAAATINLVAHKKELAGTQAKLAGAQAKVATTAKRLGRAASQIDSLRAEATLQQERNAQNMERMKTNAKLAKDQYEKNIGTLEENLATERQLGFAEGRGVTASVTAVVQSYESGMRELHAKIVRMAEEHLSEKKRLEEQVQGLMPAYEATKAFAAAAANAFGGAPKSITDGKASGPEFKEIQGGGEGIVPVRV